MDRMTFLNELAAGLARLEPEDRKQVLDYYSEMILDRLESGVPEEEAVAELEPPEQIAAAIRVEYGARQDGPAAPAAPGQEPDRPIEYLPAGGGQRIEIRARDTRIILRRTAQDTPRLLVYGGRSEWLTAEATEEAFRLTMRLPLLFANDWISLFSGRMRRQILLELPEGFAGGVSAKTTNADIEGADLRLAGTVKLATTNSSITLSDGRFDKLSAATTNSCIDLADLAGRSCSARTSNSRITAEDCHFTQQLKLATSNSKLRVEDIEAPALSLTTSNAAIKGWVRGREADYAISSSTSNARSNLPDTSREPRPKTLDAHTSNGKIDLRFVSEGESAG